MDVLVIFARHGTQHYASSLDEYRARVRRQLPDARVEWLVVDTALSPGEVREGGSGEPTVVGSSNEEWEFSAFDAGVARVGPRLWEFDLVNLVTSAHGQLYTAYLDRFTPDTLAAIAGRPVALGHIDCYDVRIRLLSHDSQHWLRTSCVFLPPAEALVLGRFAAAGPRSRWFSGVVDPLFRDDAPLSDGYKRLIADWLTGRDLGQGVRWHSPMTAHARNLGRLQDKALAMLNEHLFAARLRAAGGHTVDVTWLATCLARHADVDVATPWWAQLQGRDRDALVVQPVDA
jgi:hypothetical protein